MARSTSVATPFTVREVTSRSFPVRRAETSPVRVWVAATDARRRHQAAAQLAARLGVNLFRIDLSRVVSKYIGETEKNLARVFAAAEKANCVLLLDEADALFGRRTEVKDTHDRYANVEVAALLPRIATYAGPIVLAVRRRDVIDEAFLRRLRFTIAAGSV